MENHTYENTKTVEVDALKENLRIQKAAYIKQQMDRQRAAEDARMERLIQEQKIIEGLRESIDDSLWQTEEARKYNQEFQEYVNLQVYEAKGITADKRIGMKEYKNALHRGGASVLFILSLAMIVLCGVLHGFQSEICMFMFAYTAVEGTLLSMDKKEHSLLSGIRRIVYLLIFPMMMVMFVCFELGFAAYGFLLPYAVILGAVIIILGTLPYFLRNPYSRDMKKLREANRQIRHIEKLAQKDFKKKQKLQAKDEKKKAAEALAEIAATEAEVLEKTAEESIAPEIVPEESHVEEIMESGAEELPAGTEMAESISEEIVAEETVSVVEEETTPEEKTVFEEPEGEEVSKIISLEAEV